MSATRADDPRLATDGSALATDDDRWQALRRRDPVAEGRFLYSVATTGVYCRPSCPSRLPRRENVRFHASHRDAERAGFRACKRCRPDRAAPDERRIALVASASRRLEAADDPPSLATLAGEAGLSPSHFQRLFRAVVGVSPKAYAGARRQRRLQEALLDGARVTDALYEAGYGSSGRFYEAAPRALGMTPTAFRDGGRGERVRFAAAPCALGRVLVASTARGLCAILLGDDDAALARELAERFPRARLDGADASFAGTVAAVVRLVDDPARDGGLGLPLDVRGAAFERRVWEALGRIPVGATATYSEIAAALGRPGAARAVGGACARNPLAVAVPCHRAVARDGGLAGYRWGLARKEALLAGERSTGAPTASTSPAGSTRASSTVIEAPDARPAPRSSRPGRDATTGAPAARPRDPRSRSAPARRERARRASAGGPPSTPPTRR